MRTFAFALICLLVAGSVIAASEDVPFGIDKRPVPSGEDLEKLLPKKVGTFTREDIAADVKPKSDEDINLTYKSGNDSVNVGFSIPESIEDARTAVETTRQEAVAEKIDVRKALYSVKTDPAFFKTEDFISWTRGKYFFYAKGSSKQALEAFMRAFPY